MPVAVEFICGFCHQPSSVFVDPTAGLHQSYVEDCQVCCRPNRVVVTVDSETGEVCAQNYYEG